MHQVPHLGLPRGAAGVADGAQVLWPRRVLLDVGAAAEGLDLLEGLDRDAPRRGLRQRRAE